MGVHGTAIFFRRLVFLPQLHFRSNYSKICPPLDLASSRCLTIIELLEKILLELPIPDILHCQSVCQLWKDVIAESLPLQRALWIAAPASGVLDVCQAVTRVECYKPTPHGLLINPPGLWFNLPSVLLEHSPMVPGKQGEEKCGFELEMFPGGPQIRYSQEIHLFPPRCLQLDQSWANMFLTNPPPINTVALFYAEGFDFGITGHVRVFAPDENGCFHAERRETRGRCSKRVIGRVETIVSPGGVKIGHVVKAVFETYPELAGYHHISCMARLW
ncbi:uncharacterized protein BDZ99DRAFT_538148 [Mytilinidion resinicola]|uniref:F-box domain-containing protein n=1 Tax=Mytilinidion resinicola TaxID=574789 RepID=A0A6A6YG86_9PEZI|nr:uncharacterized protein BDZ99DRAFT_538148 [Mytilinidion resinicola]KAF2807055.1 hypothetical protein BDZ99DRAFT_538148 [Mytilinidion resinicola]